MEARPDPMVPAEVDLRDFAFMPLDIIRLFGSRFHAIANDSEWRAGVTLWCKSFHQVPAGSLPDDDVELCRLAELGRDQRAWKKVRKVAMHQWVLCSDGRWYHPVVAEKVNEAWIRKQAQRERSRRGNAARWGRRGDSGDESAGGQGPGYEPPDRPRPVDQGSEKDPAGIVEGSPVDSLKDPKGQGQGQGQGQGSSLTLAASARSPDLAPAVRLSIEARQHGVQVTGSDPRLIAAAEQGVTVETLRDVIAECARRKGSAPAIGYVLATLQGWATDAGHLAVVGAAAPPARGGATDADIARLTAKLEAEARGETDAAA